MVDTISCACLVCLGASRPHLLYLEGVYLFPHDNSAFLYPKAKILSRTIICLEHWSRRNSRLFCARVACKSGRICPRSTDTYKVNILNKSDLLRDFPNNSTCLWDWSQFDLVQRNTCRWERFEVIYLFGVASDLSDVFTSDAYVSQTPIARHFNLPRNFDSCLAKQYVSRMAYADERQYHDSFDEESLKTRSMDEGTQETTSYTPPRSVPFFLRPTSLLLVCVALIICNVALYAQNRRLKLSADDQGFSQLYSPHLHSLA